MDWLSNTSMLAVQIAFSSTRVRDSPPISYRTTRWPVCRARLMANLPVLGPTTATRLYSSARVGMRLVSSKRRLNSRLICKAMMG